MAVTLEAPARGANDLRQYVDTVVSRRLLVGLATILGALAAIGYLYITPSTFTAPTTVMVYPLSTDRFAANRNIGNLVDMNAEAVLASSFRVAETAVESLDGEWAASELRESTSVFAGADSTTMTIRVEARSEELARLGADAVADAYIGTREEQALTSITNLVDRDRARVQEYRSQLADALSLAQTAAPGSVEATRALADQQIIDQQISVVLARISSLEGIDTTGGVVLNPASVTRVVVSPPRTSTIAAGAAMGLVIGLIGAFAIPLGSTTVRGGRDIRRASGMVELVEFSTSAAAQQEIPVAAQRLLRSAARTDAKTVAFVCDDAVRWSASMVKRLAEEMTASGAATVVAAPSGLTGEASMTLIPLAPDATLGERLLAFRVSDATVLVVQKKESHVRNVRNIAHHAAEMGSPVIGAILVSGDDNEWENEKRHGTRPSNVRRGPARGNPSAPRGAGGETK